MSAPTAWRATLLKALKSNGALPNAKYVQLATVRPSGRPANRTVVFRGFLGDTDCPTFVTDARSQKAWLRRRASELRDVLTSLHEQVTEVAQSPFAEACWYLPQTREQFRLSGKLQIVGPQCADAALLEAREAAWKRMSEAGRSQFAWPEPGIPRLEGDPPLDDVDVSLIQDQSPPLPTFCLVVLTVDEVDHLMLRGNRRYTHKRTRDGWATEELNP